MMADFVCQNAHGTPVRTDAVRDLRHEARIEQDHAPPVDDLCRRRRGRIDDHLEIHFEPADADHALHLRAGLRQISLL